MTGLRALVARLTEARANRTKGCKCFGKCFDEYVCPRCAIVATAEADLADAITPDVLAAVEAVVELGKWRATEPQCEPDYAIRDRLDAIADRLAAWKGE